MNFNAKTPAFPTVNPHAETFDDFGNDRLFDRLAQKFKPKPYFKQYRTLQRVVLGASFLFHVLSAATAAALIYLFIGKLIPSDLAAGVVTLAALVALEISKRETSGRFFHDVLQFGKFSPGLLAVVLALAAVSTTCSYFGAERAVLEFTPPPTLTSSDSVTAPLRASLAGIDQQINDARKTTWKGKTTTRSQRTIERLTKQKETILAEMVRQQQRIDGKNDATETKHTATTETNATGFAAFTLCSELLLIVCLWYLQFYDYRSFAEYCKKPAGRDQVADTDHTTAGVSLNGAGRPVVANLRVNDHARATKIVDSSTKIVNDTNLRTCEHCGKRYTYRHAKQRFCCDQCRIDAWQKVNGREMKRGKTVNVPEM